MSLPIPNPHAAVTLLAFFQGTQLNLFERFLTQAVAGIDSTSITSGMQTVAYVVLLVGFLWQVYQSALHGGDVRGLGTNLIKYIVTALVVMNYGTIFTTVNQGFVNAGNWISNATGGNVLQNWLSDLHDQFVQNGFQNLWGMITGSVGGLIDGLLIIVAYILYPFVVVTFGFFYIFYGSVLYIFGPIVIALLPLGGANRIAKSYIENVFIWNAWPILYAGFGALLSAIQMGQVGQMLNQNDFLGGLGNLEGAYLLGCASIIYSLAIAVIPFIAKRIVSGDVGATAGTLVGAAVTVVTAAIAAGEGAATGFAAAGASGAQGAGAGSSTSTAASAGRLTAASTGSNQPAPPQLLPASTSSSFAEAPTIEGHADQIRSSFSNVMGSGSSDTQPENEAAEAATPAQATGATSERSSNSSPRTSAPARRGPSVHRYNIGTWGAYHAARIAAQGLAGVSRRATEKE